MEVKEIQSLPIAPAVGIPFAASWSNDNKISVITEKGVYIVEIVPDPDSTQQSLEIRRSWINASDYLPTAHTKVNCDNLVWKLNQKEVYQLVLHTYLAPKLVTTKFVSPYVIQTAWSPAGMFLYSGCLLAAVTNYGSVVIQAPRGKHWQTLVDISSLWVEECGSGWRSCDSHLPKEQFDILQARAKMLKATSIMWSPFIEDGKWCILIMGMQDGSLLFWQLNAVKSTSDKNLEPKLIHQCDTDQYHITTMYWMMKDNNSAFLCVGDVQGIIKMYTLKCGEDQFSCLSSVDLWPHNDRMQVSKLCVLPSENSEMTVVAIKGSFVIAIALDAECSVIKTKPYHVGNISVNGMVLLENNNLLVVTHNGIFNWITISRTGTELEITGKSLNSIAASKSACYGISSSANKAIHCLITSLNTMYDHLVLREPAQITFFKLNGLLDPYQALLSNPSQTLTKHWDYLEVIRLQGPPFPDVDREQDEHLSSYHLKIRMWLCKFAVIQEDTEEEAQKRSAMREHLKQAECQVLMQHFAKYVKKLTSKETLSVEECQSLALISSWIKKIESELKSAETNAILKLLTDIPQLPDHELCAICQQECLSVDNPTESKCVGGHVLPRCSVSMLQCSELPFWICEVCHSIANLNSDVGEPPTCIYCGSVLKLISDTLLGEDEEEEEEQVQEEEKKKEDAKEKKEENEDMEIEEAKKDDEMKNPDVEQGNKEHEGNPSRKESVTKVLKGATNENT